MKRILCSLLLVFGLVGAARADIFYDYVGTFDVNGGPYWGDVPAQLSGLDVAAMLFGGDPSDYVISTVGIDPDLIDFSSWVSLWGGGPAVIGQGDIIDLDSDGLYNTPGESSAWVMDWCNPDWNGGFSCINYVFRIEERDTGVPEPAALALIGAGLFGFAAMRRRRERVA